MIPTSQPKLRRFDSRDNAGQAREMLATELSQQEVPYKARGHLTNKLQLVLTGLFVHGRCGEQVVDARNEEECVAGDESQFYREAFPAKAGSSQRPAFSLN